MLQREGYKIVNRPMPIIAIPQVIVSYCKYQRINFNALA